MKAVLRLFFFTFILGIVSAEAAEYVGYLSEVATERQTRYYEVFLFAAPLQKKTPLSQIIFNAQLSKEFRDKYRERFGQMDTETIVYQPTKFSVLDENRGAVLQIEQNQAKRKAFAEYMTRRLMEWHVDNYFRTDPDMRPIYELKEKLSNVEVEVNKETKINLRYNFSDNSADLVCDNPYADARLSLMMDPKAFGPGPIEEEKLIIEKQVNKTLRVNTSTLAYDGVANVEFIRFHRQNWSTSLLLSTYFKPSGVTERDSRFMVGLGHSY